MIIEKLYFKWDRSLNTGKFKLDRFLSKNEIENELKKDNEWFTIESNTNVKLKIDAQSKIEAMFFIKNSTIGGFEINWKFIKKVKDEFESKLEICEKNYSGDKLILHFGDSFLHAASLVRQIKENNTSN
jgi:hypothetical protein